MKIQFIEFDDSFSFNVISLLEDCGAEVSLIHYKDISQVKTGPVALGPGPGHPKDYPKVLNFIRQSWDDIPFWFGICLGHQLIWTAQGLHLRNRETPRHGLSLKLGPPSGFALPEEVECQFYHSWEIYDDKNPSETRVWRGSDGEWLGALGPKSLTYQFHPESIGTSYRSQFINLTRCYNA